MGKDDAARTLTELDAKYFKELTEQVDFQRIALRVAALGEPVFPLPPGRKAARLANWPDVATTNPEQIKRWAEESPHANCAAVAIPTVHWFLDDDRGDLAERYYDETGQYWPLTRTTKTGRPGGKHYTFRQTDASRAMGNLSCRGTFDAQVGVSLTGEDAAKYVVVAGSLHPSGRFYETVIDEPIAEAPAELIAWLQSLVGRSTRTGEPNRDAEPEIVREGEGRNTYLTSLAGKLRRAGCSEATILAALTQHNREHCKPPLPLREVRSIAHSIGRKEVGEEPSTAYVDAPLRNMRYVSGTRTTRYTVEVNGVDVEGLSTKELFTFSLFQMRVADALGILLQPRTKLQWDRVIAELMRDRRPIDVPDDATEEGMIFDAVQEFVNRVERSRDLDDMLRGLPVEWKEYVAFKVADAQRHLHAKQIKVDNSELYAILHNRGCRHQPIRIKGKVVKAWLFPKEGMNRQTEDYAPHDWRQSTLQEEEGDLSSRSREPAARDDYGL